MRDLSGALLEKLQRAAPVALLSLSPLEAADPAFPSLSSSRIFSAAFRGRAVRSASRRLVAANPRSYTKTSQKYVGLADGLCGREGVKV